LIIHITLEIAVSEDLNGVSEPSSSSALHSVGEPLLRSDAAKNYLTPQNSFLEEEGPDNVNFNSLAFHPRNAFCQGVENVGKCSDQALKSYHHWWNVIEARHKGSPRDIFSENIKIFKSYKLPF
jgi:hypothetical protein